MPAASTTLRMLAVSVIASLTVTGCQTFEDAGVAMGRSNSSTTSPPGSIEHWS